MVTIVYSVQESQKSTVEELHHWNVKSLRVCGFSRERVPTLCVYPRVLAGQFEKVLLCLSSCICDRIADHWIWQVTMNGMVFVECRYDDV